MTLYWFFVLFNTVWPWTKVKPTCRWWTSHRNEEDAKLEPFFQLVISSEQKPDTGKAVCPYASKFRRQPELLQQLESGPKIITSIARRWSRPLLHIKSAKASRNRISLLLQLLRRRLGRFVEWFTHDVTLFSLILVSMVDASCSLSGNHVELKYLEDFQPHTKNHVCYYLFFFFKSCVLGRRSGRR